MIQEYFSVQLSDTIHLGLSLTDILTIEQFEQQNICKIPIVPDFWYGIVNFKGSLLWVLDTKLLFDLDVEDNHLKPHRLNQKLIAIVLTHQKGNTKKKLGLVVNRLEGIISVDSQTFEPLTNSSVPILQDVCKAVAKLDNRAIYILNSENFLERLYQQSLTSIAA